MKIKSLIQLTGAAVLFPLAASAATIVWDDGAVDSNFTSGDNWTGTPDNTAPTNDLITDIAQLTGGSVTLDADRSVLGLDVDTASTLTGTGTRLTLGGSGLTGTSDLTLGGSVILRSGTVTAYAGNITVDGGTLEGATGTVGLFGTGTITLDNGGMILDTGSNLNMRDTTSIIIGAGGGVLRNAGNKALYGFENALISGTGQLTLDGGGSTDYPGNARIQMQSSQLNTYSGGTLITNKANVQINGDRNFGAVTGKVTFDDGRMVTDIAVTFDAAREFEIASGGGRISLENNNSTIDGILSGTGDLLIDGQNRKDNSGSPSGSLRLNNAGSTHSGTKTIKDVTVFAGTGSAGWLGTGTVILDNGRIEGGAGNAQLTGISSIVLEAGGGTLSHDRGKALYGLNAVISGDGQLTYAGPGNGSTGGNNRLQVTTANTYTGGTRLTENVNLIVYEDSDDAAFGQAGTTVTFDNGRLMNDKNLNLGTRELAIAAGGGRISLNNRVLTSSGLLTGTGALLIDGQNRNINSSSMGGTLNLDSTGTGTLTGAVTVDGLNNINVRGQNNLGTGALSLNNNVQVKNNNSNSTLGNSTVTIGSTGARLMAGWNKNLTLSGVIAGAGDLIVVGDSGTVILSNSGNTYTGSILLQDSNSRLELASAGAGATVTGNVGATLVITGSSAFDAAATFGGTTIVADTVSIGTQTITTGTLTFAADSVFNLTDLLTVDAGATVSFESGFGVEDISGLSSSTMVGTYTLIDGAGVIGTTNLSNFGSENAYDLGSGVTAYFQTGSLELVVVPEPGTFALLAGMLALGSVMIRRRRA